MVVLFNGRGGAPPADARVHCEARASSGLDHLLIRTLHDVGHEVFVRAFPRPGGKRQISFGGGTSISWTAEVGRK